KKVKRLTPLEGKSDERRVKSEERRVKNSIVLAIYSPLLRGGGSREAARGWGFRIRKLNIG
ncbi:MAG: hypothetical protein SPF96_10540, partial [Prevotella sp.]|nr:hypothetical protein [Prevotella sp.]